MIAGHRAVGTLVDDDILRRITPWEMRLLGDAADGLTYRAIATRRGRKHKAIERAFERLREKLRPHGGGTKAGLVHWYDTQVDDWRRVNGL